MSVIVDKIILFFICLFPIAFYTVKIETLIVILTAISISAFCYYFKEERVVWGLLAFYYILCIINPLFGIFIPLMVYDIGDLRLKSFAFFTPIVLVLYWYQNDAILIMVSLFGLLLSIVMQRRTYHNLKLEAEYKLLRDTSQELNMYLSNENKTLIEKQDYEIYLATLQERNRIAREIHDNVGHMLSRSLLQVGALIAICKDEILLQNLDGLKGTLNDAMDSIRESVHGLRDDSIDLRSNIETIIERFLDYQVLFDYDVSEFIEKEVKYGFIMIIKEALSNTAKHSNADEITIVVREHPVFYQLMIKDNGTNNKEINDKGMGLENMRTRVKSLKGNISIDNQKGFKIVVTIPKSQKGESE